MFVLRSQDSWSGCGMVIAGEEVWLDVTVLCSLHMIHYTYLLASLLCYVACYIEKT